MTTRRIRRPRVETIDYLRGLLALGVMFYHYYGWSGFVGPEILGDTLRKVGIYAVSSFYVISGISFGYVYGTLKPDLPSMASFWTKRYFRLVPLYAAVLTATLVFEYLSDGTFPSIFRILANLTLTYGVFKPDAYLVIGGWSIGNEFAFYLAFPALIYFLRRGKGAVALTTAGAAGLLALYAFAILRSDEPLTSQWDEYISPLNQAPFFIAGLLLAPTLPYLKQIRTAVLGTILVALLAAFVALPIGADQATVVHGWPRLAYTFLAIGICAVVYGMPPSRWDGLNRVLSLLGLGSYSVYLAHGLVYALSMTAIAAFDLSVHTVTLAIPATLLLAYLLYRYLEAPMITAGKKVARAVKLRLDARSTPVPDPTHREDRTW